MTNYPYTHDKHQLRAALSAACLVKDPARIFDAIGHYWSACSLDEFDRQTFAKLKGAERAAQRMEVRDCGELGDELVPKIEMKG